MSKPSIQAPEGIEPSQPPGPNAFGTLSGVLQQRFSCRAYLAREVPRPVILQILAAAQLTASWCNAQPWRVVVTRGEETRRFGQACLEAAVAGKPHPDFPFPPEYRGVHLERRRECGWQLYGSVGIARGDREAARRQSLRNYELFGAPHVAIVTTEEHLGVYGAVDCGGYVANFMNAATSLGVACIAQAALASHPDVVRRHFDLPESRRVVCGISFGYADVSHPANKFRTRRADLEDVVTWRGEGRDGT
jgi:nitroreductase